MGSTTLKELRKDVGLHQKDVSAQLGLSIASYSKKENGQVKVSILEAKKLSEIFGVDLNKIFLACEFRK